MHARGLHSRWFAWRFVPYGEGALELEDRRDDRWRLIGPVAARVCGVGGITPSEMDLAQDVRTDQARDRVLCWVV